MRRLFLLLAATVGGMVCANLAQAQSAPVSGVVAAGCSSCGGSAPIRERGFGGGCNDVRYGLHPTFKKLLWWQNDGCSTCGGGPRLFGHTGGANWNLFHRDGGCGRNGLFGGNNCAGQPYGTNPYPNGVPGTLVFPNHPYIRSPRDFFMSDAK